jgi:hypothetical protein
MDNQSNGQAAAGSSTDASFADLQRIRELLARAASPKLSKRGVDQRSRFIDVLAEIDAFIDRHPHSRLDEVSAIRQITVRALEID